MTESYFNDLITVQNLVAVLKTSRRSGSGSDKSRKYYKNILDEALQVALEFDDESYDSDFSD